MVMYYFHIYFVQNHITVFQKVQRFDNMHIMFNYKKQSNLKFIFLNNYNNDTILYSTARF